MTDPSFSSTPYTPDRLIAGDEKLITREVTLTENQAQGALVRGAVLGYDSAADKYARVHQLGLHGAATARAVLAKDADPSGGDVTAVVYDQGEFNEDSLTLGGTVTLANVREPLRAVGVHLKSPVSA